MTPRREDKPAPFPSTVERQQSKAIVAPYMKRMQAWQRRIIYLGGQVAGGRMNEADRVAARSEAAALSVEIDAALSELVKHPLDGNFARVADAVRAVRRLVEQVKQLGDSLAES